MSIKFDVHNIHIPYLVRFVWNSGEAERRWDFQTKIARNFLKLGFGKLLVDSGLAKFAPTLNPENSTSLGNFSVANIYESRWSSMESVMTNMPQSVRECYIYGDAPSHIFDMRGRWDTLRDIYQLALAPDCCREAYFNSEMNDPYHVLYGHGKHVNKFEDASMNSLLAPIGFFISPVVACSPNCQHAKAKALEIDALLAEKNPMVYETLRMVLEMPIKVDSYRGIAIVDTPMFKATFATDALREKMILKFKSENPKVFNYDNDWVATGSDFPFKGPFSGLY